MRAYVQRLRLIILVAVIGNRYEHPDRLIFQLRRLVHPETDFHILHADHLLTKSRCYSFDLFFRHIFISIDEHLRMKFVTEKKKKLKMKKENFYRE